MWNIDLKQMQQYYGMLATLRGVMFRNIEQGKETKNLNLVDVLSVQE
jgi:hypothetical protein